MKTRNLALFWFPKKWKRKTFSRSIQKDKILKYKHTNLPKKWNIQNTNFLPLFEFSQTPTEITIITSLWFPNNERAPWINLVICLTENLTKANTNTHYISKSFRTSYALWYKMLYLPVRLPTKPKAEISNKKHLIVLVQKWK